MNSCTKETRQCSVCNMSVRKDLFSTKQWRLVVNPICRDCINGENKTMRTKECSDCHKSVSKNQCPRKEWKKVNCVCRICYEYQRSSDSLTRVCHQCRNEFPKHKFKLFQWEKGNDALCLECDIELQSRIISSIGVKKETTINDQGNTVCRIHSLEVCNLCMMDLSFLNTTEIPRVDVNKKICVMDGHPVCPRLGIKFRCNCEEVMYCSLACQKHHWPIHKIDCNTYQNE